MQAWGPGGFSIGGTNGSWNRGPDLDLTFPAITGITNPDVSVTNGIPTFSWDGGEGVTWYTVWAGTPAPAYDTRYFSDWALAETFNCADASRCSITPAGVNLVTGDYVWFIRAWGPAGFLDWTVQPGFSVP